MAIGLGLLRLSPQAFWAMTPREFERAAGRHGARPAQPVSRAGLDAMMAAFPDADKDPSDA